MLSLMQADYPAIGELHSREIERENKNSCTKEKTQSERERERLEINNSELHQ